MLYLVSETWKLITEWTISLVNLLIDDMVKPCSETCLIPLKGVLLKNERHIVCEFNTLK